MAFVSIVTGEQKDYVNVFDDVTNAANTYRRCPGLSTGLVDVTSQSSPEVHRPVDEVEDEKEDWKESSGDDLDHDGLVLAQSLPEGLLRLPVALVLHVDGILLRRPGAFSRTRLPTDTDGQRKRRCQVFIVPSVRQRHSLLSRKRHRHPEFS